MWLKNNNKLYNLDHVETVEQVKDRCIEIVTARGACHKLVYKSEKDRDKVFNAIVTWMGGD